MFFFWNQKCSLFEKLFFVQEQIMICAIFETFSVHGTGLESERKKEHFF
jgi:hypothetical protein